MANFLICLSNEKQKLKNGCQRRTAITATTRANDEGKVILQPKMCLWKKNAPRRCSKNKHYSRKTIMKKKVKKMIHIDDHRNLMYNITFYDRRHRFIAHRKRCRNNNSSDLINRFRPTVFFLVFWFFPLLKTIMQTTFPADVVDVQRISTWPKLTIFFYTVFHPRPSRV